MAQSYLNYKQTLTEEELKLQEIGQRVTPYDTNFFFSINSSDVRTDFRDEFKNEIKVIFHRFKPNSESYEAEFTVNGNSGESFKTDLKHFFKIISTVVQVINEFIDQFQPSQLYIEAFDKQGKEGQKDRIWLQYAKVNLQADEYTLGTTSKGFALQKNSNNIKK